MLVNSKEMLEEAKNIGGAIPAPDFVDLDSARTFINVAEELGRPLILAFAQVLEDTIHLEEAATIGKLLAEKANVPVALHLDHGLDFDYIKRAIEAGFSSVMIDASTECFEENIRRTKEVVKLAHAHGVTVEAEIGHVGNGENFASMESCESVYTTAEEAKAFVEATGVDSLAVSIGTVHGIYKGLQKPQLNFDRLHELAESVPVPLVLHGGSGTGDENLHRCATEGISKINIFTEFLTSAMGEINTEKPENYLALKRTANQGMEKVLRHYYQVFSK